MADVKIEMEQGRLKLDGDEGPAPVETKLRGRDGIPDELLAQARVLEQRKQELNEKFGPRKDILDPKVIAEMKSVVKQIAELKGKMAAAQAEYSAGSDDRREAELAKQAEARKRELALSGG